MREESRDFFGMGHDSSQGDARDLEMFAEGRQFTDAFAHNAGIVQRAFAGNHPVG